MSILPPVKLSFDPPDPPAIKSSGTNVKRVSVRYVQGTNDNIIYGTDYLSLDALIAPNCRPGHMSPMLDLRGHRLNDNTYAANVGLIGRYTSRDKPRIYGINAYYDFRQGDFGNYNGLGAGVEFLSNRWDVRINGYFPLGTRNHSDTRCRRNFIGPYIICQRRNLFANTGVNGEVGYNLSFKNRQSGQESGLIYFAAGPYYFHHENSNVIGGELRIRPQYKDILALDILGSYDNHIGAYGQIQIILSFPLYNIKSKEKSACSISNRIFYKPVERFEVMQLRKSTEWFTNY
jgi:hypothetical protein